MKIIKSWRVIIFLWGVILNTQVADAQTKPVSKWPRAITYEIYVQSFADSNGDGKGDIVGLTSKLDYLQELGVEAVWLMPVSPSRSYHKYDVKDYYDIDPDYGTLEDFKNFVEEAHKRNIKVVIDLVLNHCGRDHPWFQEALKNPNSPYWQYFVWTHKSDPQTQSQGNITAGENRRRNHWVKVDSSDYYYYAQFGGHMPDLNFDNPKLREEVFKIGKFWASEVKVDGFRLDAARHIFPDERAIDNHRWWEYFRQEMLKVNKDFYLVGEVWAPANVVGPYLKGIPALFDFDMGEQILKAVNNANADSLAIRHKSIRDFYRSVNPDYVDATFLTNHDQNRVMSSLGNDMEKAKMAAAILMTLPGSPYLYYGEEIGMQGKKPDQNIREPFLWDVRPRDKVRPTWEVSKFSTDSTVTSLAQQKKYNESLFNFYRTLIHLRNNNTALTYGELEPVDMKNKSVSAFLRKTGEEAVLVIHNVSANELKLDLPAELKMYNRELYKSKSYSLKNNLLTLPPYTTVIFNK